MEDDKVKLTASEIKKYNKVLKLVCKAAGLLKELQLVSDINENFNTQAIVNDLDKAANSLQHDWCYIELK